MKRTPALVERELEAVMRAAHGSIPPPGEPRPLFLFNSRAPVPVVELRSPLHRDYRVTHAIGSAAP